MSAYSRSQTEPLSHCVGIRFLGPGDHTPALETVRLCRPLVALPRLRFRGPCLLRSAVRLSHPLGQVFPLQRVSIRFLVRFALETVRLCLPLAARSPQLVRSHLLCVSSSLPHGPFAGPPTPCSADQSEESMHEKAA